MKISHDKIKEQVKKLTEKNPDITTKEIYTLMKMDGVYTYDVFRKIVTQGRRQMGFIHPKSSHNPNKPIDEVVLSDIEAMKQKSERITDKHKNEHLMGQVEALKKEVEVALKLKSSPQSYRIEQKRTREKSHSTAIALASDWHLEEVVQAKMTNGLNQFDEKIAKERVVNFARNTARLWEISNNDTRVSDMVLGLLGDFITGNIHQDNIESCRLRPAEAVWEAQNHIKSVIDYLLQNTDCKLIIPCHMGNHSRITKKTHWGNQSGNSLEWLMYKSLEAMYGNHKRIQFIVADGYHTFVDIDGFKARFHHGDAIRFAGGIGGLFIPAYKAISQWNKSLTVSLDCFGHHHQSLDGGSFLCNGSLIGYNAFAIACKCGFEKPTQSFCLINHKYREKTNVSKIFL